MISDAAGLDFLKYLLMFIQVFWNFAKSLLTYFWCQFGAPNWRQKYEKSANCKKELGYADSKGTHIVPIKCEEFAPSGWLGIILSTKLWTPIQCGLQDTAFEACIASLVAELRSRSADEGFQTPMPKRRLSRNQRHLECTKETTTLEQWLRNDIGVQDQEVVSLYLLQP